MRVNGSYRERVSLRKWWNNPYIVLISDSKFPKEEIVLDLAQTDGGSHVDPALNKKYASGRVLRMLNGTPRASWANAGIRNRCAGRNCSRNRSGFGHRGAAMGNC
jgi:hypothetical protein